MKHTTIIDPIREEEVLIYAKERSALVEELERLCDRPTSSLIGYQNDRIKPLSPADIYCFMTEGGKLYAMETDGTWQLRCRLYELEEMLGADFVKIHQSCIINITKIKRFEASVGGALMVLLEP